MAIYLTHRWDGIQAVEAGDDEVQFAPRAIPSQSPLPNPGGLNVEERKPIKIVLGPRPRPPRPTSIIVVPDVGGRFRDGSPVPILNLAEIIAYGEIGDVTAEMLRTVARSLDPDKHLRVDALLPQGHSIDVAALSNHFSHLSNEIGHPIAVRLGTSTLGE